MENYIISKKKTYKNKLISSSIVITTILIITISIFIFHIKSILIEDANILVKTSSIQESSSIENLFNSKKESLKSISNINSISNPEINKEEKINLLKNEVKNRGFKRMGISDLEGNVITTDNRTFSVKNRWDYKEIMLGKEFVYLKTEDIIDRDSIFIFSIPIVYNEKIQGILFSTESIDNFLKLHNINNYLGHLSTYIVTLDGEVIAQNSESDMGKNEFLRNINLYSIENKENSVDLIKYKNEEYYVGYSKIKNSNDLYVLVSVPKNMVLSNSNGILLSSVMLVVVIMIIVFGYFLIIVRFNKKFIELQKSNTAKKMLLANVSHEMRTPLSGIIGLTSIVNKFNSSKKVEFYLEKIEIMSNHLLGLINDMLDISKIEANGITINNKRFNIGELVDSINIIIKDKLEEKKHTYIVSAKDIEDINVFADEIKIKQILINLLINSIKFTPNEGKINLLIKLIEKDEINKKVKVMFEVSDNGIGMSEEFKSKIFEPFSQEDNLYSRKFDGSGLGLFICKRLLIAMDSYLIVESKLSKGSKFTFSLWLPLYEEINEKDIKTKINVEEIKGKKVLLVEDNEINRIIAVEILEEMGIEVDSANNGQEGIDKFEASEVFYYSYIFMDIQMPIMDGYEVTKIIRNSNRSDAKKVKIIAITANSFVDSENEVINSEMNGYIVKPINKNNILSSIIN